MDRPGRRRAWFGLLALSALSAALAGCATAPSGGAPRPAPGGSNQVQAYVQPLAPPGPNPNWTANEVVLGFLHASASYAFDPTAARQYLVPSARKQWFPGREPVAVVGKPTLTPLPHPRILNPSAPVDDEVQLAGQQLATLSQTGQYQYAPGEDLKYKFVLTKTNGVWLIQKPPKTLLLTESDFEDVYEPRNLFFFARPAPGQTLEVLVPDPVYAPLQSSNSALNTDVATGLVNGLLKGQGGWLSGATESAFPPGTRLLKKVTITGKTAQVDLGGPAVHSQPAAIDEMADQLLATLSDGSYSPPLANQVQLYIDNRPQDVIPDTDLVPDVTSGPVQLVTGAGSVGDLAMVPRSGGKPQPELGATQLGQDTVTAVASSADPDRPDQIAVAVANGGGCTVETKSPSQNSYQPYRLSETGGSCTSLSWDDNGNLWAVAGQHVWVLPQGRAPEPVAAAALSAVMQAGDQILQLRMAPDAVRAALLVKTPDGNRLLLTAVRFHGGRASLGQPVTIGSVADPLAISWYDAYHLAVLADGDIDDVPLTGSAGQQLPQLFSTAPTGADALTTDGSEFVVATSQGQVYADSVSSPGWVYVANGADPVYQG